MPVDEVAKKPLHTASGAPHPFRSGGMFFGNALEGFGAGIFAGVLFLLWRSPSDAGTKSGAKI